MFALRSPIARRLAGSLAAVLTTPIPVTALATNADATTPSFFTTDLGTLESGLNTYAEAVSNSGQVVGFGIRPQNSGSDAFSWTPTGGIVVLPNPGGGFAEATAVNDSGQVVGWSNGTGSAKAFSWTAAGGVVSLGTLGNLDNSYSQATAVNNSGQVVGGSSLTSGATHAFSWTATGGMVDLGTLGGSYSQASAVNDSGQVVGPSTTASGATHAFSWTPGGGMVDLGTLGGSVSQETAVNDSGQVVGSSTTASGATHAFSWTPGGGMVDLGTLGGSYSGAAAVNDSGEVVGASTTASGATHAFSWTAAGGMVDLGAPAGHNVEATAVNNSGQVVGWDFEGSGGIAWTATGIVALPALGGFSTNPRAINDSGQIVGVAATPDTTYHAVVWQVRSDFTPPILSNLTVTPTGPLDIGTPVTVTATAADTESTGSIITSAEVSIDGGQTWRSMSAGDGRFDQTTENLTATVSIPSSAVDSLCVRATDAAGNTSSPSCVPLTVLPDTTPPVVSNLVVNPDPAEVNTPATVTATATDTEVGGTAVVAAAVSTDGGQTWSPMRATNGFFDSTTENMTGTVGPFPSATVVDVCVRATDLAGNTSAPSCSDLPVYDPSAGFVTGGGWISSPPGAYVPNPSVAGTAEFGFVSAYKQGATAPSGNTEFQFQAGGLDFKTDAYQWLVISGGKAQYKGTGEVNGVTGYGFLLTACDAEVTGYCAGSPKDSFRIKIWNIGTGATVYDNAPGPDDLTSSTTALGGGEIMIHK